MSRTSYLSRGRRLSCGLLAAAVVAAPALQIASVPTAGAVEAGSVGAAAASSWQSNGTVWKMAYAHGDIFLIGDFTALRPPGAAAGTNEHPAMYFAALNAATGALDTNIQTHTFGGQSSGLPLTNGSIAASPDGSTIYVGGKFTTVDGSSRPHIAAFSATTGHLLQSWHASVGGRVTAIAAAHNAVYIGGAFGKVNGKAVGAHLAALSPSTGNPLPWGPGNGPSTNDLVDALATSANGSQVIAGGYFTQVDGQTESGDHRTTYQKAVILGGFGSGSSAGRPEPMPANRIVPLRPVGVSGHICNSNVKDLVVSGSVVYLANEGSGGGCFDGTWAVNLPGGTLKWLNQCFGATQTIAVVRNYLYKGSHAHDCQSGNHNGDPDNFPQLPGNQSRHLLSQKLSNGFLGPWYPNTNAGAALGPRAMATDGTQLYVGGDFTSVNHRPQQGIARFTPTHDYPTPQPHRPTAVAGKLGQVTVTVRPPLDLDDPDLTMELFRNGGSRPVAKARVQSLFWRQPAVHLVDRGAVPGTKATYRVRAVDTFGRYSSPLSPVSRPVAVKCAPASRIHAAVTKVSVRRLRHHHRLVRVNFCTATTVRVSERLTRGHHLLAHAKAHLFRAGHRHLGMRVGRRVHAGRAHLTVVFRVGAARQVTRRVIHLPR
jgi:hypothetical protein